MTLTRKVRTAFRRMTGRKLPARKPCDAKCPGVFINTDNLDVERCDTCRRFDDDTDAGFFINALLTAVAKGKDAP